MKRVLSIILAVALLCCVAALAACGNGSDTTTPKTVATGSGTEAVTTPAGAPDINDTEVGRKVRPGFEDVNFGGKVFTIATPYGRGDAWENKDIGTDEEDTTDPIDLIVEERNMIVGDLYDCTIVAKLAAYPTGELTNDFATGTCTIDMVADRYALSGFAGGNYYNLNNLDVDFSQPWFDQGFIRDLTIDGKIYAMAGDFSLEAYNATWTMFVNLDILETNEGVAGTNIFDLVRNHEWTVDVLIDLCRRVMINGDTTEMTTGDASDVFGLLSSDFQIRGLYYGSGNNFVIKTDDAAGNSSFSSGFAADSAVAITDKIIELIADPSVAIPTGYTTVSSAFVNGQTLFVSEVLKYSQIYADSDIRYSPIPEPMLTAEQGAYYHSVDNHASYYAVPKTITDKQVMSDFIEVFAYHSRYVSYQEYLNLFKFTYASAAQDSADMVEIIVSSRIYDAGYELGFGGFASIYAEDVLAGTNNVSSNAGRYTKLLENASKSYKDAIAKYNDGIAS